MAAMTAMTRLRPPPARPKRNLATVPAETASRRGRDCLFSLPPPQWRSEQRRALDARSRDPCLHVDGPLKLKFVPCRFSWRIMRGGGWRFA